MMQILQISGVLLPFSILILLSHTMAGIPELKAVVEGIGDFSEQLYNVLSRGNENVFFSPLSVHASLAMIYQGADGSTKEVLTKALNVSDANQAAEGYKVVMSYLNNSPNVQLLMANKVYLQEGINIKSQFKEVVEKNFRSEVEAVNFNNSQESAAKINKWFESTTQHKFKDLIRPGSIDPSARLILLNAVYFKGKWAYEFNKSQTTTEEFYLNDNDSIDVKMMRTKGKYFYREDLDLDAKFLELPYANPNFSLMVILPNKRNGLGKLEEKLANISLLRTVRTMFKTKVIVKLPKVKVETTIQLQEPLSELGLGVIFDMKTANFSKMHDEDGFLWVDRVTQKVFFEINEEGIEAAADTGVMMDFESPFGEPPVAEFTADHPHIIVLNSRIPAVDEKTHAVTAFGQITLFHGRVSY